MKKLFFFLLLVQPLFISPYNTIYIIIHGTWAQNETWPKPGGDFYEGVKKYCNTCDTIIPFSWSGKNSFYARDNAGEQLAQLIAAQDPTKKIVVVGHSHGGNVAIKASQILVQYPNAPKIKYLYTLGIPVHSAYEPNMDTIEYLYNLFSFQDLIQPLGGGFCREYEFHERIANISVVVNDKEPDHSGLHCAEIAEWISILHDFFHYASQGQRSLYSQPGRIYFYTDDKPRYEVDKKHRYRVQRDIDFLKLCVFSLTTPYMDFRINKEEFNPSLPPYQESH